MTFFAAFIHISLSAGFPTLIWFGKTKFTQPGSTEKLPCMILVMEYLSSSLSDLFTSNNKKFSLKSVLMLSEQMVIFFPFSRSTNRSLIFLDRSIGYSP